uniref:non-specific serine/threonine protein kinase n=1 Tax=Oryza punctata TaxID=4537 RepID=A0A0E0MF69_ORYPU
MGRDTRRLLLFLLFLAGVAESASSDADAIHDLAKSVPSLGWDGDNVCGFEGVTCERGGSGKVTELNLADKALSGTLPPTLSSLTSLTALQLQGNALTGAVPSLSGMASLTRLALDGNAFTSLPTDFLHGLTSLQYLSMDNLPLQPWPVPDAIANCSSLDTFYASNASISGAFPAVLATLVSLRYLRLSYNNLTGGLPPELSSLIAMESLQLNNQRSDEKLSGPIDVIASMKSLKLLWIQSNKFTGPIPDLSGTQLEAFNVRDNMLTGVVPTSLTGLVSLKNVSLSNNNFQGPKPVFAAIPSNEAEDSGNGYCLNTPGPCSPLTTTLLEVAEGFGYPYELAKTWKGNDPCSPAWVGIVCTSSDVSMINLSAKNLSGRISPALANLTRLARLDLSNNNLTGVIPDALTTLPSLTVLNVANNRLTGEVPKFKPSVNVLADGNLFGESSGSSGGGDGSGDSSSSVSAGGGKSKPNTGMIIGIIVAVIILFACIALLVHHRKKKNVEKFRPVSTKTSPAESEMMKIQVVGANGNSNGSSAFPTELYSHVSAANSANIAELFESHGMLLSMEVLLKATNNFSEDCVLGRGGFGVVFKGNLNGKLVAVKRCDGGTMGTKGQEEFLAEIDVLRKVRHRHLVALLGYCTHGNERLLVYEYMSGGTLREHLCDLHQSGYNPLTWTQRMTIALDVARGIEYLHGLAQETFIHRDLKPSNILLDQDLRAKVSDFGLVKLAKDTDKSLMTRIAGTFGYLAPEYATTGKVTTKVDVYAYGVILMEMVAGRKVLDDSLPDDETHLVTIFRRNILDKEKFRKFVDPTLELSAEAWKSLLEVADLARHCTAREPYQRPDMCHCVNRLSSLVDQWKPTNIDEEDYEGETSEMGLHQQLEKWRCDDFTISDSDTFGSFNMPRKYN